MEITRYSPDTEYWRNEHERVRKKIREMEAPQEVIAELQAANLELSNANSELRKEHTRMANALCNIRQMCDNSTSAHLVKAEVYGEFLNATPFDDSNIGESNE